MVHGINDRAQGKPSELAAEQGVIDDVEEHRSNGSIQNLLQRQASPLGVGSSSQQEGHHCLCSLLDRGSYTSNSSSVTHCSVILSSATQS